MDPAMDERRLFTVDDLDRMVEAGIFGEDELVELLDGEVLIMSHQGSEHAALTVVARELLREAFGSGYHVRDHSPLRLDDLNRPAPDVAVVRGDPREYLARHPTADDVVVVVEVSKTSQRRDRRKAGIYGRTGIPRYWILDIDDRRLVDHCEPGATGYRTVRTLGASEEIVLPHSGRRCRVADLLP